MCELGSRFCTDGFIWTAAHRVLCHCHTYLASVSCLSQADGTESSTGAQAVSWVSKHCEGACRALQQTNRVAHVWFAGPK